MVHIVHMIFTFFFRITIIGGYSWTHQKCVNTIQTYDPSRDTWERPGNLPIELSGVKAAVLCIPYSLSSTSKKGSVSYRNRPFLNETNLFSGHELATTIIPGTTGRTRPGRY